VVSQRAKPCVRVARVEVGMNSHKGFSSKSKTAANLFRGRPGRRPNYFFVLISKGQFFLPGTLPFCTHFYATHKEYIWTAWSRMNLEAAKGSAALTWRCKHVAFFLMAPLLSRRHFLKSSSAESPPNPPNWLARMPSMITNELIPPPSDLSSRNGIVLIGFGGCLSENQRRYTP
jgi:hypothetical protein